jgi:hypothetical protein
MKPIWLLRTLQVAFGEDVAFFVFSRELNAPSLTYFHPVRKRFLELDGGAFREKPRVGNLTQDINTTAGYHTTSGVD